MSNWGSRSPGKHGGSVEERVLPLTTREVFSVQNELMECQDHRLSELESSVQNLHEISSSITGEVQLHNALLEDVTEASDRTREAVVERQSQLSQVSASDDTCRLWLLIVILMTVLVVLLTSGS